MAIFSMPQLQKQRFPEQQTSSLARTARPFTATTFPSAQTISHYQQEDIEHGTRPGHSLETISIFPHSKKNDTGLPDTLKHNIEALSGIVMDDVRVHPNSAQPAYVQAFAYTHGTDIHLAPGQEEHLAHEAWHVVQQKQGRVTPTTHLAGRAINDHQGLETEADTMGARASNTQLTRAAQAQVATSAADMQYPMTAQRTTAHQDQALQRTSLVIQRNKNKKASQKDQLETAFTRLYQATEPGTDAGDVGALGAPVPNHFIVAGGEFAANHHIYPKSKLTEAARKLSKLQATLYELNTELDSDQYTKETRGRGKSFFQEVTRRTASIGLTAQGDRGPDMTNAYYWNRGNLFVGINPRYRTDDPQDNEERRRPNSLSAARFQAALKWGRDASAMAATITTQATNFSSTTTPQAVLDRLDEYLALKAQLGVGEHRTSEHIGEDWAIAGETSGTQYLKRWGFAAKQYEVNKNAQANAFTSLSSYQQQTARYLAIRVSEEIKSEAIRNLTTQTQVTFPLETTNVTNAYTQARDTTQTNPTFAYRRIVRLQKVLTILRATNKALILPALAAPQVIALNNSIDSEITHADTLVSYCKATLGPLL